LPGHFSTEVGRAMEDAFISLLYRLGYFVYKGGDFGTGLDIVAKFSGEPIVPKPPNSCTLLPPFFAPAGTTAFSIKRGNFRKKDVNELIEKTQRAKHSENEILKSLEGMVIATNFTRQERDLDSLRSREVYCWDGRRLIFYAAKAQAIQELASRSAVRERAIEGISQSSYLLEVETSTALKNVISANVVVFIDDHDKNLLISADHVNRILEYIYEKSLEGIVKETQEMDVQAFLRIHALGVVNESIVRNAYKKYAQETSIHPKVTFSAEPMIFQYGSAPWEIVYLANPSSSQSIGL